MTKHPPCGSGDQRGDIVAVARVHRGTDARIEIPAALQRCGLRLGDQPVGIGREIVDDDDRFPFVADPCDLHRRRHGAAQ